MSKLRKQIQTQIQQAINKQSQIIKSPKSLKLNQQMSSPIQQSESFSQINMNVIKNTKLFQKFMQNKSGLLQANGSTSALVNKTVEVKSSRNEEGRRQKNDDRAEAGQKWGGSKRNGQEDSGQRKMVVNLKRDHNVSNMNIRKQLQNDMNNQNSYQEQQYYQSKTYEQPQDFQQQKPKITRSPRPQKQSYEQPQVQSYQNQRLRQQDLEYYESQKPKTHQFQEQAQNQQFTEPSYTQTQRNPPAKRKRNFNPNMNTNNQQKNNQPQRVSPPSKQQPFNSNKFAIDTYVQETCSNIPSSKPIYPQQRTQKLQSSPGRSNTMYPHSYNMPQQKYQEKSYSINNQQLSQQNQSINPQSTPVQYSEAQYKQKYDQLLKKHEQLKFQLKNESKSRKQQSSEWQHEIQLLKQKLFDVQSRQDSLLIQNQRLKDKCQSQNLTKMKTQQQNKQLTFRIKELQDQLQMKQSTMKQKSDQTHYWKQQVDAMKQELNVVKLGLEKKIDQYNLLLGDYQIVRKQRDNKDYLLEELRKNINGLVQQNSLAKDEIFKLVTKLYQMEQENQVLRNDLKRQQLDNNTSQINNYMKDLKEQQNQSHNITRQRVQSSYIERDRQNYPQHNIYEPHVNMMERSIGQREQQQQQRNQTIGYRNDNTQVNNRGSLTEQERPINGEKPTRRRGEFARERGQVSKHEKVERDQRPLPTRQNDRHQRSIGDERSFPTNNHSQLQTNNKPQNFMNQNNHNKFARMQQISQELQKIKDMKAMNGAIRRKKIDLERQLQELEQKMN